MEKLNNFLRIPCKSFLDTADLRTRPQTLYHKRAHAQEHKISINSGQFCASRKNTLSQIRQKHLFPFF